MTVLSKNHTHNPAAYVCGLLHDAFLHIVYPILLQPEAMGLRRVVYECLDVLAYEFEELFKHNLGLLQASVHAQR